MNILKALIPNSHKVHVVYLVPSDCQERATDSIRRSILHLQAWYQKQLGNGKTFTLDNPVVRVCHSTHNASWFPNNDPKAVQPFFGKLPSSWHETTDRPFVREVLAADAGWYWNNVQNDARSFVGDHLYQENDDWIIYVDTSPNPGQYAGGTPHVAILGRDDMEALMGISNRWTQCRAIGGSGHEIGHSFGLPHPPPPPNPDWPRAIMGVGYSTYPDCILTDLDKIRLNNSPFFSDQFRKRAPAGLCPFSPRPVPPPRPRPEPHPRPHAS